MKEIALTKGGVALVDDDDFDVLRRWSWHLTNHGYAARGSKRNGHKFMILMHRQILCAQPGTQIDHINGDQLDNRKVNLRLATNSQNQFNSKRRSDSRWPYKGVSRTRGKTLWRAQIRINGKSIGLGSFATAEDAARAYDEKAKELFGEFARPNFPEG